MTQSSQISKISSADRLAITEVKPGLRFPTHLLQQMLPDAESVFFFGKVYELDAYQLGGLLKVCLGHTSNVVAELTGGMHSVTLQDYLTDIGQVLGVTEGDISVGHAVPKGEILPHVWADLEVEVAKSVKEVAAKLGKLVGSMPGKNGAMAFQTLMKVNSRRPTIGDFRAQVTHTQQKADNLVIFDVSGSMTRATVEAIVDDVVALSYVADAHLAIVSNTATHWEPGQFSTGSVLQAAEFGGTQYEQLAPLLQQDWGTVVTIADYDSSPSAKGVLARCTGTIDQLLDISLVNHPTFLAECVGQRATNSRPVLIGASSRVLKA